VVNLEGIILGAISWQDVLEKALDGNLSGTVDDFMHKDIITTFPEESLRSIADRMATHHVGVLPVVDREQKGKLRGLITQFELLEARDRILQEERKRERILKMWSIYRYGNHEHSAISSLQHYFRSSKDAEKP
jgi:predicted transcriptional regulator